MNFALLLIVRKKCHWRLYKIKSRTFYSKFIWKENISKSIYLTNNTYLSNLSILLIIPTIKSIYLTNTNYGMTEWLNIWVPGPRKRTRSQQTSSQGGILIGNTSYQSIYLTNTTYLPDTTYQSIYLVLTFEVDLMPISLIAVEGGPTKMTPVFWQRSANSTFSERKPYPGCTALEPVSWAT